MIMIGDCTRYLLLYNMFNVMIGDYILTI